MLIGNVKHKSTYGAIVVNAQGDLLPYTVAGTVSSCEEKAKEIFGADIWERMQKLGAYIKNVDIIIAE